MRIHRLSGALGRADLLQSLRVLEAIPSGHETAQRAIAESFGFGVNTGLVAPDPDGRAHARGRRGGSLSADQTDAAMDMSGVEPIAYRPKRPPRFWRIWQTRHVTGLFDGPDPGQRHAGSTGADDLEVVLDGATAAVSLENVPNWQSGHWQVAWDRCLIDARQGRCLDLKRALRQVERARPPEKLPRRRRSAFNQSVLLILDLDETLRPIWSDLGDAWRHLRRLLGEGQLDTVYVASEAAFPLDRFNRSGRITAAPEACTVVAIGAFGGLTTGTPRADWQRLFHTLRDNGHPLRLLSVCPLDGHELPIEALDPHASHSSETLLSALSQAWWPHVRQLRRLRLAIPGAGIADELVAYNHPDVVRSSDYLALHEELLPDRLHAFKQLSDAQIKAFRDVVAQWQPGLGPMARALEGAQSRLGEPLPEGIRKVLEQLGGCVEAEYAWSRDDAWGGHRRFMLSALPLARALADTGDANEVRRFLEAAQSVALDSHDALPLRHSGLPADEKSWCIHQHGAELLVDHEPDNVLLKLAGPLYCEQTRRQVSPGERFGGDRVDFIAGGVAWRFDAITRPAWAHRLWRGGEGDSGLYTAHDGLGVFHWPLKGAVGNEFQWLPKKVDVPGQQFDAGVDEHGLWMDVTIPAEESAKSPWVTFSLRYIPAGRFEMGSADTKADRDEDENLHNVTLSQGLWMAETSVTQALWRAVLHDNPSHHEGDDLPAEQVSWTDCQRFIERLNALVAEWHPKIHFRLPSEAEWEYACRAGTNTAYWWGDKMNETYANNGGSTKPEHGYPANAFGLRSMSGNVYEWCADWYGDYPAEPVVDPEGPAEGGGRVLRGGSWVGSGRWLRSASRIRFSPDFRNHIIGFRLAAGLTPQVGKAGARGVTADGPEQSGGQGGGQDAGGGAFEGDEA